MWGGDCDGRTWGREGMTRIWPLQGKPSPELERQAVWLYSQGLSTKEVASAFGTSKNAIRSALLRNGIEPRKFDAAGSVQCAKCLVLLGFGKRVVSSLSGVSESTAKKLRDKNPHAPKRNAKKAEIYSGNAAIDIEHQQREAWRREWIGVGVHDCLHWLKHIETSRWAGRRQAAINYRRWKKDRSNCFLAGKLRKRIYRVMRGVLKSAPTLRLLGCTVDHLKFHLESKFKRGMNWENYGRKWHIDHVLPCASFDLTDPRQQAICFHYTNLQPLEAKANIRKGKRLTDRQLSLRV